MRQLDWLGASLGKSFTVLSSKEVKQFVEFDVTECNLLVVGQRILKEGRKVVPIGGFVSAQLAELWALWREHENLSETSCDQTGTRVNEQVRANPRDKGTDLLLPPPPHWPSLSLTGDSDFCLGSTESTYMNFMSDMVPSPNIAQVTPELLHSEGFEGWWNPVEFFLGQIDFGFICFAVLHRSTTTTTWGGADVSSWLIHCRGMEPRVVEQTPYFATQRTKSWCGIFYKM